MTTPKLTAWFSDSGNLEKIKTGQVERHISSAIVLDGFLLKGIQLRQLDKGGLQYTKQLTRQDRQMTLVERFVPTATGLRWVIELTCNGSPWSTPINIVFKYPANTDTRFWTAWANPNGNVTEGMYNNEEIANAIIREKANAGIDWTDPLQPMPLIDQLFYYGAPYYTYDNPRTAYCPFQGDVFCIPMVTLMEEKQHLGFSLIQSPKDLLLDFYMQTSASGKIKWTHLNHRLGEDRTLGFSMDIVVHEADWRAALGWVYKQYPNFFEPTVAIADSIAGTGAYSRNWMDFDTDKLKKMAFAVNWKASHDFPYMGMFLPPVHDTVEWRGFWRKNTDPLISLPRLRAYSKQMKDLGFYVLSYFNVTEFGTDIKFPAPPLKSTDPTELWKDANGYLYTHLADAILYTPPKQKPFESRIYGLTEPNQPFWTWGKGIIMDPGEPVYQNYLLAQAHKHNEVIPDAYGICIDRMDWLRMYNHRRDDGVSWMGGQPVRSLYVSWMELMEKLAPIFHDKNKVVYVNNHIKRLEQLKYVDGLFDEFTAGGSSLNTIGFLGIKKPVLGWINKADQYKPDPDWAMQKFLYMGVFPMAPFPANDHSLRPDPWIDQLYLDYGPLLIQLRGKKWVLEPHVVEVKDRPAKANIFKTFEGFAIPVVFAKDHQAVQVLLKTSMLENKAYEFKAIVPGSEKEIPVKATNNKDILVLDVPIKRGCSMLVLREIKKAVSNMF